MVRAALFSLFLLLHACDGGEGAKQADGSLDPDSTQGIFGDWAGTFSETADDPDLSLKDVGAEVSFVKAEENGDENTFKITMEAQEIVVEGSFGRFDNETLLLKIDASNLSSIGEPGTLTEVDYKLQGSYLKLSNERFSLLSQRKREDGEDGSQDGEKPAAGAGYVGFWACEADRAGNVWEIEITPEGAFRADIRNPGRAVLWQTGSVEKAAAAETDAVLTVESSNVSKYIGERLYIKLTLPSLQVQRKIPEDGGGERDGGKFRCFKND